jgi:hypothetical protein
MEISLVRKRVRDGIEQAQKAAAVRRAANHEATRVWDELRERMVAPTMQQVSQVLKSENRGFRVETPGGTVRLSSERSADDYIEVTIETSGPVPVVVARVNRTRGRERFSDEHILASGDGIPALTEEKLLDVLITSLAPFLER